MKKLFLIYILFVGIILPQNFSKNMPFNYWKGDYLFKKSIQVDDSTWIGNYLDIGDRIKIDSATGTIKSYGFDLNIKAGNGATGNDILIGYGTGWGKDIINYGGTTTVQQKLYADGTGYFSNRIGIGIIPTIYGMDIALGTIRIDNGIHSGEGCTGTIYLGDGYFTKSYGNSWFFHGGLQLDGGLVLDYLAQTDILAGYTWHADASGDIVVYRANGSSTAGKDGAKLSLTGGIPGSGGNYGDVLIASNGGKAGLRTSNTRSQISIYGTATDPDLTSEGAIVSIFSNTAVTMDFGTITTYPYSAWLQIKNINGTYSYPLNLQPAGGFVGIGKNPSEILMLMVTLMQ